MLEPEVFAKRRAQLFEAIGENNVAIVFGASEVKRNADCNYPFRQDSHFFYLTGFAEPDACAIFAPGLTIEGKAAEFVLFVRPRNPNKELWDGPRAGLEGAVADYGASQAFEYADLHKKLPDFLASREKCYFALGESRVHDTIVTDALNTLSGQARQGVASPEDIVALAPILGEFRVRKSVDEQRLIRKACDITAQAHIQAMRVCKPGMMEYELEAQLMQCFYQHGSRYPAYTSIVATGKNACVLHYIDNQTQMQDGDLVLIDAGCEYHHYASDVTRTFPVSGKFTQAQASIYEWVLRAQQAGIDAVKPGVCWHEIQATIVDVLVEGLLALDILKGDKDELIKTQAYARFYMHQFGHWMGMDVHDVGHYKVDDEWRPLEPGMVFTIEPGLYMGEHEDVDRKWWNIGIRIEDDILVTQDGCDVLTDAAPKSIAAIEALMHGESA